MNLSSSRIAASCTTCTHRANADVCNSTSKVFGELQHLKHIIDCRPKQCLFYEGHPVLAVYVLCQGRLKLTRTNVKGQQRVVKVVEPGQIVEWHIFEDSVVHHATAETLESSRICLMDRLSFLNLIERDHGLALRMLKLMSEERVASLSYEDQLAFNSARERMASLLIDLATRYGETTEEGSRISLQLKRDELAQMAAISVETAVRLLQSFQQDQMIQLDGRHITILQPTRLARVAKQPGSCSLSS